MKINLILIILFISTILSAQRFRQDISNFATNDALRNDFVVPKANDKVYVIATMKLYNYDASDTTTADDDETVIVQGTRRWKCLNCASGGGSTTLDSLNIFDGVNTFRYANGELEIYNNEDNKAIAMQNGRIHISRDGEVADQDTDVLIRSEIEDLISDSLSSFSGGSGVPYENSSQDTLNRPSGIVIGDVDGIGEGQYYELGDYSFIFKNNSYPVETEINGEEGIFVRHNYESEFINIVNKNIRINRTEIPTSPNEVLTLEEIETMISTSEGSRWYFVSNLTDTTTTVVGPNTIDFMLNITNGFVYERPLGYWNYIGSLKGATGAAGSTGATGATGANGLDGTQFRTGAGAPSNGLGVNGDLYLNTSNGDVYKKDGGIYSVTDNLTGPTGLTGATGSTGSTGATGAQGKGFVSRSAWSNAVTNYVNNTTSIDFVTNNGNTYYCILSHNASVTADDEPGIGASWQTYWAVMSAKGDTGSTGSTGAGIPTGGTTGQILSKIDGTNYNTQWVTPSGGGGGGAVVTYHTLTASATTTTVTHTFTSGKKYEITLVGSYSTTSASVKPILNFQGMLTADLRLKLYSYNSATACTPLTQYGNNASIDGTFGIMSANPTTSTVLSYDLTMFIDDIATTSAVDLKIDNSLDTGTGCTWQAGTTLIIREY